MYRADYLVRKPAGANRVVEDASAAAMAPKQCVLRLTCRSYKVLAGIPHNVPQFSQVEYCSTLMSCDPGGRARSVPEIWIGFRSFQDPVPKSCWGSQIPSTGQDRVVLASEYCKASVEKFLQPLLFRYSPCM